MSWIEADRPHLLRALDLAARGALTCAPNPMVGCVLVRDGVVVAEGWHERAGGPHAETLALGAAGPLARGATAYVTLEPCAHFGRTPPCAPALAEAGIARVVVGVRDPDPRVDGRGLAALRQAGIEVVMAPPDLRDRCLRQNCFFLKRVRTGLPFVTMKFAMTLDGKIATATGHAKWISSEESRARSHWERARHDGIMAGIGTVLADDPQLNCRMPGGRDPVRILVDSHLRTPPTARALQDGRALVACLPTADPARAAALRATGAEVLPVPGAGRVGLRELMALLAERGIGSILLEGGGRLNASALAEGVVDRVLGFVAPFMVGGETARTPVEGPGVLRVDDGWRLHHLEWQPLGPDLVVEGFLGQLAADSAENEMTSPSSAV